MAVVRFPKPEIVLSEPWIEIAYLIKICYASSVPSSQSSAIIKAKPGSRFSTLWPPS